MTTDAYKAAISKLEQIEDFVKGIDFDYEELNKINEAKEELDSSLKKLLTTQNLLIPLQKLLLITW